MTKPSPTGSMPFLNFKTCMLALCIALAFSFIFAGPIWDTDFWWHLATGRHIVENWSLLEGDPFTFTSRQITPGREVALNGYWLSQVLFYLCYKLFGPYGIILLRAFMLISVFLFAYFWGKKERVHDFVLLFLVILSAWFTRYYTGDRPQLFSFLFAPATVYLLESFAARARAGDRPRWIYVLLPALMVVWANCHRGFVMGPALVCVYWAAEIARSFIWRGEPDSKYLKSLSLLALIAIGASLINPYGYEQYLGVLAFQGSTLQQMTSEYVSPFSISKYGVSVWPYWVYMSIATAVLLLTRKELTFNRAAVTLFLALMSLSSFRYIPFFMYATIPIIAGQAASLTKDRPRLQGVLNKIGIPALLVAMAYMSALGYKTTLSRSLNDPVVTHRFPVEGARFVKQQLPPGNIYNNFEWGGYLIWELHPDFKVFIDGRNLNQEVFVDAMNMMWDQPQTPRLFDKYDVDIVMVPRRDAFTGEFYTVINYLTRDDKWRLAYADNVTLIFTRN